MALTNEDLQAIAQLLYPMQNSITDMQGDIKSLQSTMAGMQGDIKSLQSTMAGMQGDIKSLQGTVAGMQGDIKSLQGTVAGMQGTIKGMQNSITDLRLHIENVTDANIQLLAENHIELTNKLNQLIPIADNNRAYEVKVNYLFEKVSNLEKEVAELKGKIA